MRHLSADGLLLEHKIRTFQPALSLEKIKYTRCYVKSEPAFSTSSADFNLGQAFFCSWSAKSLKVFLADDDGVHFR